MTEKPVGAEAASGTIPIRPEVALREVQALAEHYRNRNLLLAQALADTQAQLAEATAALTQATGELEALTAKDKLDG